MSNRREFVGALAATSLLGANDKITFGVIATGGRGRYLQERFQKLGAQCVAICDIYGPNLEKAGAISPEARRFGNYHELLAQKMDCVVIASPDHHHWPMLQAALAAKKDVYLEKPLSKSLEQSKIMVDAVRASQQVVQIGMQRRSAPALIEAKRLVDEGVDGIVVSKLRGRERVEASRVGTAPATIPRRIGATAIYDNTQQPRAKPIAFAIVPEMAIRAYKRFLHRVLGVVTVAKQMRRHTQALRVVPVDEKRECLDIASEHASDDLRVRLHSCGCIRELRLIIRYWHAH